MTSTSIRSEKAAVVSEVREKLAASDAAIVTEYRGMTVAALAQLRRELRKSGAEYKVYKNTLARFAAREAGYEGLESMWVCLGLFAKCFCCSCSIAFHKNNGRWAHQH